MPHGRNTTATPSPWPSRATGDPKFRHGRTFQRKVGFPFMILCDLTGHRPHPGSYGGSRSIHRRARRRSQTFYRRAKLYTSRSLGFKQSSFHHSARVLRNLTLQRLWMFSALMTCYVSFCLSASGKSLTQEHPSKFLPSWTGIRLCVKWRTRFTLEPANTIKLSVCSLLIRFKAHKRGNGSAPLGAANCSSPGA
jgi:hypothetical protein